MQKRKTAVALCLVAVMVFMWVRVLLKEEPASAEAALMGESPKGRQQSSPKVRVSFIELPKVQGRNDVLMGDFFDADGWRNFVGDGEGNIENVSVFVRDGSEEIARRLANRLKLQATWLDKNPQAFINDRLLSVGEKFDVREGNDVYECEVAEIEQNMVLIRCREAEIVLKLSGDLSG
ncbi:MAG: hypothetical protein ACYS4W_01665 [Planctomycetota bacterium]